LHVAAHLALGTILAFTSGTAAAPFCSLHHNATVDPMGPNRIFDHVTFLRTVSEHLKPDPEHLRIGI